MSTLKPTHVTLDLSHKTTLPKITLPIKTRFDGRGYAVLQNKIVEVLHLNKNQEIEIKLKFDNKISQRDSESNLH